LVEIVLTERIKMSLLIGKKYNVNHTRKGKFTIMVSDDDGDFVTGVIKEGTTKAIMDYNVKRKEEEVSVRKCFCSFELAQHQQTGESTK
jgi:hypothetical protein